MISIEERKEISKKTSKPLMWIGIVSIVMLFAGLTSGYVVIQADAFWVKSDLPIMFWYSTALIVASSVSMFFAVKSIKSGNLKGLNIGIALTLVLGIGFTLTQVKAWGDLTSDGKFFVGKIGDLKGVYGEDYIIVSQQKKLDYVDGNFYSPEDRNRKKPLNEVINRTFNTSSSFLYVLSGLHLVHLAGGLLFLLIVLIKAYRGKYSQDDTIGVEVCSTYWHFLDGLWIYLFLFLLFIR